VDAPYFYRNNTLDINFGDDNLSPEYLNSWQLSFYSDGKIVPRLKLELNGFINKADKFIIQSEVGNANAGNLTNAGVEFASAYSFSRFSVDGNLSWQSVLASENFAIFNRSIYNVPDFQANLTASYDIISGLRLSAHALFTSAQKSQYALPGVDPIDISIPARILFDAGICYQFRKFEVGINVYNLAGTSYMQGGSSVAPLQQAGRWFLGHISYQF
jgi:iron complex outermembrane receptor protein